MQTWQLQEAKAHLSEVVRLCAQQGPQVISVRGKNEAVLVSKKDYDKFIGVKPNFFDFMRRSPLKGIEFNNERDPSQNRDIDL